MKKLHHSLKENRHSRSPQKGIQLQSRAHGPAQLRPCRKTDQGPIPLPLAELLRLQEGAEWLGPTLTSQPPGSKPGRFSPAEYEQRWPCNTHSPKRRCLSGLHSSVPSFLWAGTGHVSHPAAEAGETNTLGTGREIRWKVWVHKPPQGAKTPLGRDRSLSEILHVRKNCCFA